MANEIDIVKGSYERNSKRMLSSEDLLKSLRSNSQHSAGYSDEQGSERCEEKKVTDEAEVLHNIKHENQPVKVEIDYY